MPLNIIEFSEKLLGIQIDLSYKDILESLEQGTHDIFISRDLFDKTMVSAMCLYQAYALLVGDPYTKNNIHPGDYISIVDIYSNRNSEDIMPRVLHLAKAPFFAAKTTRATSSLIEFGKICICSGSHSSAVQVGRVIYFAVMNGLASYDKVKPTTANFMLPGGKIVCFE